jgi:hypothetical protein
MTDRERWTVYPLLFLALGFAFKDKLVRHADFAEVSCNKLVVNDRAGRDRVIIGTTPTGGILQLQGDNNFRGVLSLAGLVFVDGHGNQVNAALIQAPQRKPTAKPHSAAEVESKEASEPGQSDDPPTDQQR